MIDINEPSKSVCGVGENSILPMNCTLGRTSFTSMMMGHSVEQLLQLYFQETTGRNHDLR